MTKQAKAEPVGYVVGWHVNVPEALHHPDVRLDIKLYDKHYQFKAGDHIYTHPPTSEWNDAIEAAASHIASGPETWAIIDAIRALKREPR